MRVAIYARYSSDLQRATSIEDQIRVARTYADAQGWTVDESRIYSDAGISGASIDGRPGLQALMAAAAAQPRHFEVLLVDDSSRVARDIADAIRVLQTLKFFGIRAIYISQHIDSDNEQAETLVAVHGMVDSLYLREAAKKIKRGLAGQHSRGFATGSTTFGYRTFPVPDPSGKVDADGHPVLLGKRVEIHPDDAATIQQVYTWYASGIGVESIVAKLNREGHRGPRGRRWRVGAVRRLLANEKYCGRLIWGRRSVERRPGTRQKVLRENAREQWHVQERPELRIVTDDLWQRVQARRQEVRTAFAIKPGTNLVRGKNAALYSRHLFSGLMRCGVCGGAITAVCGGKGSPRYGCPQSWRNGVDVCSNRLTIRAKVADAVLLEGLRAELLRPETVQLATAALADELNRIIDQRPALRQLAEGALRDARRRLENLIAALEGGAGAASVLEAIRGREADVQRLTAELDALSEPLEHKLKVMPTWVRRQFEDTAGLLSESPERTKAEFTRLGVAFTLHPVHEEGSPPFLMAHGTTDIANILAGAGSISDRSPPRSALETAHATRGG